ncbi:hypothetical protein [Luteococcus japonicus]|uniref:Putative integral membrane protein n=2 Tax=Luteococcus TaxID=33983 RepID=A0A1R4J692_9ACTN|nr:hypothetical protein [Luteococcus japonicus]SJN27567.1 putative integral membrane protein [Luteococcus japonicus LSP_Lj1]
MILFSIAALLLGVLAYGFAGAQLHSGSRHEGGALHSVEWWTGTFLQAIGFLATLAARHSLPLLIVQSTATLGLGITALLQHLQGVRRMVGRDWLALTGLLVGLGMLASATLPGHSVSTTPTHLALLAALAVLGALGLMLPVRPLTNGVLAGLCFSFGAIGARLLMGDPQHALWIFWQLPLTSWFTGILTGIGIVLGQVHMTRGLAAHDATPVLGPMYVLETLLPGAVGIWLMDEHPRPGSAPLVAAGLALALLATGYLVRREAD